ncbi:AlwI family type II restriction endonuclease [Chryseobacterium elymi]|uniref:AlwI family type II restriction endonuclease n=1 Tax=Chryseobacterium elymi TaxID=395936 RepID=A0A3D9DN64_9FLAO|nr:AlwI family type II restriction endonuclease [Chryseobacterium elymi]REC79346.1 AlwI family type II restriction endonuclease [Chryseobacterium elymi]
MANLSKTKALFGFTSPRTIEKIIPEIKILCQNFEGQQWSGNEDLQAEFFQTLFDSEFYEGETFPTDPALAARDRMTRAPKAFGFVDLQPEVKLTQAGELLLAEKRLDELFTRQLLKFQLPSPYHTQSRTVSFAVRPYLELIRLIKDLGSLSKTEIALFFSQLTNFNKYDEIVEKILKFRRESKEYKGSRKMYINECFENEILEIFEDEVVSKKLKTRESSDTSLKKFIKTKRANMKDYADAFVRYIRATELITFQKRTFRLIISPQKLDEVDYLLNTVSRNPFVFKSHKEFKEYIFNPFTLSLLSDNKELLIAKLKTLGLTEIDETLNIENLKDIFDELKLTVKAKNIEDKKRELKDYKELPDIIEVFEQIKKKDIPDPPLFLEWNVWRSFVMLNYAKRIDGNFIMDIDGMPLNTAPGNMADLEIEFDDFGIIGEVTLSSGATQFKMEGDSVPRHFGNALRKFEKDTYCIFIATNIHEGCLAHFFNLNRFNTKHYGGKTKIIPLSLDKFIEFINIGVSNKFSDPIKLKNWLENQWVLNQTIEDEEKWKIEIDKQVLIWAV